MTTCGYICPLCNGKGFTDSLDACYWCTSEIEEMPKDISESKPVNTDCLDGEKK